MTLPKIAFLGLGAMGSRIAENILDAGFDLTVWNRSPKSAEPFSKKGAVVAATPMQAVKAADVVFCMVTDDEASRKVWLDTETGAASGLKLGAIAVELSTLTVGWTRSLNQSIREHGNTFLAGPVVGSRPQADTRQLICLLSGPAVAQSVVKPILAKTASVIHSLDTCAHAMALKLAVNSLFAIQTVALSELLSMLCKAGLSARESMSYLADIPVMSPAMKGAGKLIVSGQSAPLFPIDLVEKDLRYVLEQTSQTNQLPMTAASVEAFRRAIAQGLGNTNITNISAMFELSEHEQI